MYIPNITGLKVLGKVDLLTNGAPYQRPERKVSRCASCKGRVRTSPETHGCKGRRKGRR